LIKIAIINGSGGVHNRYAFLQSQSGTTSNLKFIPERNLHCQSRLNQPSFSWINDNGFFQTSMKIKASSTFGLILWDNGIGMKFLDFNRDLFHSDSSSSNWRFFIFFRRGFCRLSFKSYSSPPYTASTNSSSSISPFWYISYSLSYCIKIPPAQYLSMQKPNQPIMMSKVCGVMVKERPKDL